MEGSQANEESTYQMIDELPRLGENIYRIRYVVVGDLQEEGYSEEAVIFYHPKGMGMAQVYPNPTTGNITIELLEPGDEPAFVEITTPFGKLVAQFEIPAQTEKFDYDMGAQLGGVYLIKVKQQKIQTSGFKSFQDRLKSFSLHSFLA